MQRGSVAQGDSIVATSGEVRRKVALTATDSAAFPLLFLCFQTINMELPLLREKGTLALQQMNAQSQSHKGRGRTAAAA